MILPVVFVIFLLSLVLEAVVLAMASHRAARREEAFWEGLRTEALTGYDQVFDGTAP